MFLKPCFLTYTKDLRHERERERGREREGEGEGERGGKERERGREGGRERERTSEQERENIIHRIDCDISLYVSSRGEGYCPPLYHTEDSSHAPPAPQRQTRTGEQHPDG